MTEENSVLTNKVHINGCRIGYKRCSVFKKDQCVLFVYETRVTIMFKEDSKHMRLI